MFSNVEGRLLKVLGLGFLAWLIPFVLGFSMFIMQDYYTPYYRAIMVMLGVMVVSITLKIYLPGSYEDLRLEGWFTAITWFLLAVLLDMLFEYVMHPFQFNLRHFLLHQGWLHAYIPIVCISGGYLAHAIARRHAQMPPQTVNFPHF